MLLLFLLVFQVPFGLPDRKYVTLTTADKALILKWINNKLGANAVKSQRLNKTTNRCESSNVTILKSVPKNRTFTRNFAARANSACHSISLGQSKSSVKANTFLGASNSETSKAHFARIRMAAREEYQKMRKRSDKYKAMRKRLRVLHQRCHANNARHSYSTGCQDPAVRQEHSYDLS